MGVLLVVTSTNRVAAGETKRKRRIGLENRYLLGYRCGCRRVIDHAIRRATDDPSIPSAIHAIYHNTSNQIGDPMIRKL
jgi:hypothetical protein